MVEKDMEEEFKSIIALLLLPDNGDAKPFVVKLLQEQDLALQS